MCHTPEHLTPAPRLTSHPLQGRFQLGIFSSASALTVSRVLDLMHQTAAGEPPGALFSNRALIFTRQHTQAAPQTHVEMGGKDWDTIKPLHSLPCCQGLQQVLLVDDDEFKVRSPDCWAMTGCSRTAQLLSAFLCRECRPCSKCPEQSVWRAVT